VFVVKVMRAGDDESVQTELDQLVDAGNGCVEAELCPDVLGQLCLRPADTDKVDVRVAGEQWDVIRRRPPAGARDADPDPAQRRLQARTRSADERSIRRRAVKSSRWPTRG